jgi:hypothetical protein
MQDKIIADNEKQRNALAEAGVNINTSKMRALALRRPKYEFKQQVFRLRVQWRGYLL